MADQDREMERLLADLFDGELDEAGRRKLAAEIERDPAAAGAFDDAAAFEALLHAAHSAPPAAAGVAEKVRRRLESAPAAERRPTFGWRTLAAAAVLFIAAATGAWLALRGEPNEVLSGRVLVDGRETTAIPNGARVEIAAGAPATIRLADGSQAKLAPASRAVLCGPAEGLRQVVSLEGGAGDFTVKKGADQFKVRTLVGSVTVTGTEFSVELRPTQGQEREGESAMKGKLGLALAVAVTVGSVQVEFGGKTTTLSAGMNKVFAEEVKKEEPKKEEPKSTLPEGVRGFSGQVKGTVVAKVEKAMDFKVSEVLKTWEANKATDPKALAGLTVRVSSPWVKVGDKMQQAATRLAFIQKLAVGQEVVLELRNTERDLFVIVELTKEQRDWAHADREEPKKEEPKKEEPKKEEPRPAAGDAAVVGQQMVLSDRKAAAEIAGVVLGRERNVLKIKVEKAEGQLEWKEPKGETGHIKVGEPLSLFTQWEKGENGQWRPTAKEVSILEKLRVGDKIEIRAYFDEHPRMASITVTARGEVEKKPEGDKKPPEKKSDDQMDF